MTNLSVRSFVVSCFALVLTAGTASAQELPSGWSTKDVGAVAAAGAATSVNNILTVAGSGADVWGTADEFRFVYQPLAGDGSIVTQVSTVDNVHAWTKAGIMMRDTLSANSRHAFMAVSAGKGLTFQRRTTTGGTSTHVSGGTGTAPHYLKLTRVGHIFSAHTSLDGITWTAVGSPTTITMGATVYVGFAVTSHVDGALASATFSSSKVTVTPAAPAPAPTPVPPPDGGTIAGPATLRVLHWNTHHGGIGTDGKYNPDRLVASIAAMNADIVSLNEVGTRSEMNAVVSRLNTKTGRTWKTLWDGRGNLVLTRLSVTADSICVTNAGVGRKATHLSVIVNGRPLNVWSAHLANDSASARLAEAKAVVGCAQQWADARIVAGDFNATSTRSEIRQLTESYADAWVAAKALGAAKNYAGNCDGCTHTNRIDYVFTSKSATFLTLKSAEIVDTRDAKGVRPSDHKPLLVIYSVN